MQMKQPNSDIIKTPWSDVLPGKKPSEVKNGVTKIYHISTFSGYCVFTIMHFPCRSAE